MRKATAQELEIIQSSIRNACEVIRLTAGGSDKIMGIEAKLRDMFFGMNSYCITLDEMIYEAKSKEVNKP